MTEGWKCPGCGACFAPFVQKCDTCLGIKITLNPQPIGGMNYCPHEWGAPRTSGTYCILCGVLRAPPLPPTTTCFSEDSETGNLQMTSHEWLGSSHGDYCTECGVLKATGQILDFTKSNCGVQDGND